MEECSPEEVLNKAAGVSENEDLWVFVAPGALDERARPGRSVPLLPHAFDVPVAHRVPARVETTWPVASDDDLDEVIAPPPSMTMQPTRIPTAPGNGGAKRDMVPDLKKEPVAVPPGMVPAGPAKLTSDAPPPKVKVVVLPKLAEVPQIPEVPEGADTIIPGSGLKSAPGRVRLRAYKISFETGARFWKRIAVSGALAVVAGVLVAAVALRPHLPQSPKPVTSTAPARSASSGGVKPSTVTKAPSLSQPAAPPASRATPQVTNPAVPQVAAKPAAESAKPVNAKAIPEAAQKPPLKSAASPVATNADKAQPVRRHSSSSEADIVAEDTVVFYNRKPASSSAKAPQDSGVKQ